MKTIIATGTPGCGRKEALAEFADEYCAGRGKRVKIFNVGELMQENAARVNWKLQSRNTVNAPELPLSLSRLGVMDRIWDQIYEGRYKNYDAAVICLHSVYYWNDTFRVTLDPNSLADFNVDLTIAHVDDFRHIGRRLADKPEWAKQELNDEKILHWQNLEVDTTKKFIAGFMKTPFFAVPTQAPMDTLYKLIFHPEIEPVYVSMPISHFRAPEQKEVIDRFVNKLNRYFTVFDPRSVEILGVVFMQKQGKDSKSEKEAMLRDLVTYRHLVRRDVEWFLGQGDKLIVYWPSIVPPKIVRENKGLLELWPKAIASPGVTTETCVAFGETKDVWTVFRGEEASPFVMTYATELFFNEKSFFRFLARQYPDRKNLVW